MANAFPDITFDELERLIAASEADEITLWTLQHKNAVERLERKGFLTSKRAVALPPDSKRGKQLAYEWMRNQMIKRLQLYDGEFPIWAWLVQPPSRDREDDILLRIVVPRRRIVFSFYQLWERLLKVMDNDAAGTMVIDPYFAIDKEDKERVRPNHLMNVPRHIYERSWERMFCLNLAQHLGLLWNPQSVQATLGGIYRTDMRERPYVPFQPPRR